MKKLKPKLDELKSSEELTRSQLKQVLGGSGIKPYSCSTGASCEVYVPYQGGGGQSFYGNCAGGDITPVDYFPFYTQSPCYCNVGLGSGAPLSSNGGTSRCQQS